MNRFMGTSQKLGRSLKLGHLHVAYIIVVFLLFSNYYSYNLITNNTTRKCISISPNSTLQTDRLLLEVRNKGKGKIAPIKRTPAIIINKRESDTEKLVRIFNKFGNTSRFSVIDEFALALEASDIAEQNSFIVLDHMSLVNAVIAGKRVPTLIDIIENQNQNQTSNHTNKFRIILGAIACGKIHTKEVVVMLKSAALFSQDTALHIVIVSDEESIVDVAQDLLELKWTGQILGWEISFELHLDWFPPKQVTEWITMYKLCATQRLFFPTLLPHIDSLIYLDVDVIVVSNLTQYWMEFNRTMGKDHIAATAQNNEPTAAAGWYPNLSIKEKIPYFGVKGLNAGVMLMNLTRMREFNFAKKAIATHELYKEKIQLADQDILNILFAGFPEKAVTLDCSLNFNRVHCTNRNNKCDRNKTGENECFCTAVLQNGVQIVHGDGGTFKKTSYDGQQFFSPLYSSFQKLDLLTDSPSLIFEELKKQFNVLNPKPCYPLTGELLYGNAAAYFHSLSV